ncbi:hypothetical protein IFM89_022769 [Coptis chinensis]|uniref:Multidrug and toxic compound extrusion protein n=1 Tax=Coptis chinensis TaxID=261450 RepID=A0A835ISM2_9MAGN|nr:hypothetical protein IFM89_022769 [Coptis chinensis]
MVMGETVIKITEPLLKTHPSRDDEYGSKKKKAVSTDLSSDRIEEYLGQENLPSEWWALLIGWELRQLWSLCGLCIIISVFNFMLSLVTQMFIGHYMGSLKLAGVSIAILEIQGFAFIIMVVTFVLIDPCFSTKAFKGLWSYSKIAFSSLFVLSFESWFSIGLVLSAGFFASPAVSIASFAICLNYLHLDLAFMLGVCTAASIRVGGELEGAHPTVAKFSAVVANCNSLLISLIFCAIVLLYGGTLSKAFTSDIEVIKAVSDFSPLLAFSIFLNGIEPILSGVAIGAGRAGFVVCSYACNYYLVGLGLGYGIAFMTNFGVSGIWWGVILGFLLQTITLVILAIRINWNKESEKLTRNDRKRIRNKFISVVALIKWKRLYEQTRLPVSTE